ncbi:helix-turn-helix transcriptional regulator [Winslowiella iniecta]|uniref:LuxR family transcriptional regulator n=1 Tax=Winslowiella iniecta TaxID=1560201 RepID=A0A0L7T8K0_9GAMM|nr:PAS domain-containing protein [Winslowiella iniecta]KOC88438.1 LuxR family transcriptional regulator [Winslowiella iniecta]KOC91712.1 LuxR family transcriptional regulator [Winslowiella iniecta]
MSANLKDSLQMLIRFWENSAEPWGAKDNQSRFIYANKKYHSLLALPAHFSVEGRLDGELPASTADFQDAFQNHDRMVERLLDRVTSIEIHPFENHAWLQPWFFDKYPLIDERGICRGTIFHGRPVDNLILTSLNKIKLPESLVFTPPSSLFSKREWEVLFYILHAFSSLEISHKLHLSQRTVCNITQSIYKKAGVSCKRGIIEYCHDNKISNYIPQSFFERCQSLPLISE